MVYGRKIVAILLFLLASLVMFNFASPDLDPLDDDETGETGDPTIVVNPTIVEIFEGDEYDVMTGVTLDPENDEVEITADITDTTVLEIGEHTITYSVLDDDTIAEATRTINVNDPEEDDEDEDEDATTATYSVVYRTQSLGGTYSVTRTDVFSGSIGSAVTAPALTFTGFTFNPGTSNTTGVIAEDGGLTLTRNYIRNSYNVTFRVAGRDDVVRNYSYGQTITPIANPTRVGYRFSGWSGLPATMPATSLLVTATFVPINYNALFYINSDLYQTILTAFGTQITAPTYQPAQGYTFSGWTGVGLMGAGNVSFNSTLSANTNTRYTVRHMIENPDGSTYSEHSRETKTGTTGATATASAISILGYTFDNSSVRSGRIAGNESLVLTLYYNREGDTPYAVNYHLENLDGTFKIRTRNLMGLVGETITTDIVPISGFTYDEESSTRTGVVLEDGSLELDLYYTRNTYTLTYEVDGAARASDEYLYEETITPRPNPTRAGYTFSGWSTIPSTMPANDVTITGTFTEGETADYAVNYYLENLDGTFKIRTKNLTESVGETVTITPIDIEGFTYDEESSMATGVVLEDGSLELELYYTRNTYTLTYEVDGVERASDEYLYEETITPRPNPTRLGYIFSGWSTIPSTMPANNVTITGTFTESVIADYTVNRYREKLDGTWEMQTREQTGTVGELITITPAHIQGFTYDAGSSTSAGVVLEDGSLELNLYYTRNTYTLTYKVDGASDYNVEYKFQEQIEKIANPTKTGYVFTGWSPAIPNRMPANNITAVAQFTSITEVMITFDPQGGSVAHLSKQVILNSAYGQLPIPVKEDYRFDGWFTTSTNGTEVISSTTVTNQNNHTLFARWTYIKCDITTEPCN